MGLDIAALARMPMLASLDEEEARLLQAARLWVGLRKQGIDPGPAMTARLGSKAAAWKFWLLMEEVGTAWPDPFLLSPPCCGRLTGDEATLCQMLHAAAAGDRAAFLRLLEELLPIEFSDRLYSSACSLISSLAQPARSGEVEYRP